MKKDCALKLATRWADFDLTKYPTIKDIPSDCMKYVKAMVFDWANPPMIEDAQTGEKKQGGFQMQLYGHTDSFFDYFPEFKHLKK